MKNTSTKDDTPLSCSVPVAIGQNVSDETGADQVFICDECGDTLWDAVLEQEDKMETLKSMFASPATVNK